ncbi:hypothetical protein DPMN_077327 [Dreissena polymorpha]|uniref:Uncharacterized protein n=1 Tax=Dreissena polymorpha TaxID=45954 RepID=A0A9D3YQD6_DREPO|nr:hypothetical protein DPMN_077327 [Dreissena polymorpha]
MLSLMSVTVCAMFLVFGVVYCNIGVLPVSYKCPDGYPTKCVHPKETCPYLYLYSGQCPNSYYCCYLTLQNKTKCECKDFTTFDKRLCNPLVKMEPCNECCFRCP